MKDTGMIAISEVLDANKTLNILKIDRMMIIHKTT